MALIGWHTAIVSRSRSEKTHVPAGMTLVGCLPLIRGFKMFWPPPTTTSQPRSVKPIGTSAVSQGEARLPVSRDLVWTVQIP
jgi:hypothetical protein